MNENQYVQLEVTALSRDQVIAKLETAKRIYLGKANACCCGCSGTYAERGTPLFKSRVKKVLKLPGLVFIQSNNSPSYCRTTLPGGIRGKWLIIFQE